MEYQRLFLVRFTRFILTLIDKLRPDRRDVNEKLYIMVAFSLSVALAGNEKANATKAMNMTNATKNMTNVTKNITYVTMNMTNGTINMTNATESLAKTKSYRKDLYL
jgi:hypothetical protein